MLLLAIPDFFLINGTEHLQNLLNYGSVGKALEAILHNMFTLDTYKLLTWQQWTIIGIFLLLSSSLYILTTKLINRVAELREKREKEL